MSSFFDLLTPLEVRNKRELNSLRDDLLQSNLDRASVRLVKALSDRVDRLELVNQALIEILIKRDLLSQPELDRVAQQIDLDDGIEDGKRSSTVADAPTCIHCGRFVNPEREACVFCGNALSDRARAAGPPVRKVQCAACGASVSERSSYFSTSGLVCTPCFDSEQR